MTNSRPPDLVSIGEILVDFVAPGAEDLSGAERFFRAAGGAPANVAVAAARFGTRSAFIGAVGRDPFGSYLLDVLRENSVDVAGVQIVPQRTTLAFVAKNDGGIPDFVFYRGADGALAADGLPRHLLRTTRLLHASSLPLTHAASGAACLEAIEEARGAGALISVDPNLRPSSWTDLESALRTVAPLIEAADILKVNEEEARLFSGLRDLDAAADSLVRAGRLLIVTLGSRGCMWHWGTDRGSVATPPVQAVDSTGAGDAFVGAVLSELARARYAKDTLPSLTARELVKILQFASAAGALACLIPGAMPSLPNREQVKALMARAVP